MRTNSEFEGPAVAGFDAIRDGREGWACNDHGAHATGIAAGRTYGVAGEAITHLVRTL